MISKTNVVLAAAIAALLVLFYLDKCVCNHTTPVVVPPYDSLRYYKDRLGNEVAAIKQREADFARISSGFRDSIGKLVNTKGKLLNEIIFLQHWGNVIIEDTIAPIVIYKHDTISGRCQVIESTGKLFANAYYKANVFISFTKSPSRLTLETFDTLRVTEKIVKEGNIFNRQKYLQIDAANSNPYNRISGLSFYRKPLPKPKKFGIGFQAGYGFSNGTTPSAYIGIGIQYSIIRF